MALDPHINPESGVWDDNYYARTQGGAGGSTFNFDYAKAATDAYGELGAYYDRLLKESKGDLDLALSRLVEDYDKGVRIQTEDSQRTIKNQTEDTNTANAMEATANKDNALSRGLYQKSLFAPFNPNATPTEGMGIADTANPNNPYGEKINQNNLQLDRNKDTSGISLARFKDNADVTLARNKVDLPLKQQRYAADLEQQRRTEAAGMAETRGNRELQKWQSSQVTLA